MYSKFSYSAPSRYKGITTIYKGLHSLNLYNPTYFDIKEICWDESPHPIALMLSKIPKGSTYYVGKAGDICSDRLILLEVVASNTVSLFKIEGETKTKKVSYFRHLKKDILQYVESLNINTKPS